MNGTVLMLAGAGRTCCAHEAIITLNKPYLLLPVPHLYACFFFI